MLSLNIYIILYFRLMIAKYSSRYRIEGYCSGGAYV